MNAALKPGTYSIERALDEWIAERDQDKLHNTKARHMRKVLLAWCQRNGIEYLTQIEKQALRTWRSTGVEWKYRSGDSCSLKTDWSVLASFFTWAVEGDLLPANPCPRKKWKFKPRDVVPLSYNQMDRLEAAVEKMHSPGWNDARRLKMRLLIQIMRWSGMALVDAVCLPRVELVKRTISSRRHKTDKWFTVPIPEPLAANLRALENDDPRYFFWLNCTKNRGGKLQKEKSIVSAYGDWYKQVFEMAGMAGSHSHQLRHSFATHHLEEGVDIERVAEWMGDSPNEVRKTYGHWSKERTDMSEQAMAANFRQKGLDTNGNPMNAPAVRTNNSVQ